MTDVKEYLNKQVEVIIDRPMGSRHPKFAFFYPVNYGYITGTKMSDGEELDVYVLGVFEPCDKFSGMCIAYIQRLDDMDDKLVVVPKDISYTDTQIRALTEFQERFFRSRIIRA